MLDKMKGVAGKGLEAVKEKQEEKRKAQEELKAKLAKLDEEGTPYCPKCYSTSLSANKRGWKWTTGLIGSGKILITCMKCGHRFKPGKR